MDKHQRKISPIYYDDTDDIFLTVVLFVRFKFLAQICHVKKNSNFMISKTLARRILIEHNILLPVTKL